MESATLSQLATATKMLSQRWLSTEDASYLVELERRQQSKLIVLQ